VVKVDDTLLYHPLDDHAFLQQMAGCRAYASTAGFESICEAMYMGKPVLMVPAHIEQECNAFDAMMAGAGVVSNEFSLDRLLDFSATYKPDGRFIYWANNTSLILNQLTLSPTQEYVSYPLWLHRGYVVVDAYVSNVVNRISRISMAVWSYI